MPPMPPISGAAGAASFRLDFFSNHSFGCDQKTRNRCCVLQCRTNHLCRVDNASFDHVGELIVLGVITIIVVFAFKQFANDHGAFRSGVLGNVAGWCLQCATNDFDTNFLIPI